VIPAIRSAAATKRAISKPPRRENERGTRERARCTFVFAQITRWLTSVVIYNGANERRTSRIVSLECHRALTVYRSYENRFRKLGERREKRAPPLGG